MGDTLLCSSARSMEGLCGSAVRSSRLPSLPGCCIQLAEDKCARRCQSCQALQQSQAMSTWSVIVAGFRLLRC